MLQIDVAARELLTLADVQHALFREVDSWGSWIRTAIYFTLFLGALVFALLSFPWRPLLQNKSPLVVLAPIFSLTALALTWRLILIFFVDFVEQHGDHPDPPNLFVEAYVLVVDEAPGWWWSCTLLTWVTVACPVAHVEAIRRGMPARTALAYVVLAFLGAVSLAFPLLLTHLLVLPPPPRRSSSAAAAAAKAVTDRGWSGIRWLWPACTVVALLSTVALPLSVHTSRPLFIVALALLHLVLAVPFLVDWAAAQTAPTLNETTTADAYSGRGGGCRRTGSHRSPAHGASQLSASIAAAARPSASRAVAPLSASDLRWLAAAVALVHACSTGAALVALAGSEAAAVPLLGSPTALLSAMLHAATRNVCQRSISIDAALSSLAGAAYVLLTTDWALADGRRAHAAACCLLTPLLGPASTLALVCAQRAEAGTSPSIRVNYGIRERGDGGGGGEGGSGGGVGGAGGAVAAAGSSGRAPSSATRRGRAARSPGRSSAR